MRIKWNMAAFRALRTAPGVTADLSRRAERVAAACGDGFVARTTPGTRGRSRAAVITASPDAIRRNARDNTLVRNLRAGS